MAPKSKADYAFLLHDLYHLKPDGIMTIVLPHGVLFRGGEEGDIRRNLIEKNNIDAIIGLPANIFFGTGIPTIIMVLRQKRENTDVLIVDASKHFEKISKNNKLRASDIKRIVDAVTGRQDIPKFSRKVSRDEIRRNDYNLNIPRYVDSSETAESWDILATMSGGIPNAEIDTLDTYWKAFPNLRRELFRSDETPYSSIAVEDVAAVIRASADVQGFTTAYRDAFLDFGPNLYEKLIAKLHSMEDSVNEDEISSNIFGRLASIPIVDRYEAYQILDNHWSIIASDLETIRRDGFAATKCVDPNMVLKKKDGTEEEVQEGWVGRIVPFELVQQTILREESEAVRAKEIRVAEISGEFEEIIESLSEEEKDGEYLNDDNTAFVAAGLKAKITKIYADIDTDELRALRGYIALLDSKATKGEKLKYVAEHPEAGWDTIEGKGVYAKGKINARIKELQGDFTFPEDSFEAKLLRVSSLMEEEKSAKREVKELATALHQHTKEVIEGLTNEQVLELLRLKWIVPLSPDLHALPEAVIATLSKKIAALAQKYAVTLNDLDADVRRTGREFTAMLDELTGNEFDMRGLTELKILLGGEVDGRE